jgi:hypothetical protein
MAIYACDCTRNCGFFLFFFLPQELFPALTGFWTSLEDCHDGASSPAYRPGNTGFDIVALGVA